MDDTDALLAEAHRLGFSDDELADAMPPSLDELIAYMLAGSPLGLSPKCYWASGDFRVHVQPDCRCRRG